MKKITILFLMIFAIAKTQAQNYQVSFAGTGASATVDSVKVENLTQCTDTMLKGSDILQLNVTGINEPNLTGNDMLSIRPNPMNDYCIIAFEVPCNGKTIIELYDIAGNRILQEQSLLKEGRNNYKLTGIGSGIYILKIVSGNSSYTAKIVSNNQTRTCRPEIKQIEKNRAADKQNACNNKSLTSVKSVIDMQYTAGDRLKFAGFSGIYRTVLMLVPNQSQSLSFNFVACTDADNNNYAVVQIGSQLWMAENINVGTKINSTASGSLQTDNAVIEKYCLANNLINCNTYGGLYEWNEMMQYVPSDTAMIGTTQGICPSGWHIPTHHEWTTLERAMCTNGNCDSIFPYDFTTPGWIGIVEGGKLKETCSTLWSSPNIGATDESGFTALPGGCRSSYNGSFDTLCIYSFFLSASEIDSSHVLSRVLSTNFASVCRGSSDKMLGFSVRYLKN